MLDTSFICSASSYFCLRLVSSSLSYPVTLSFSLSFLFSSLPFPPSCIHWSCRFVFRCFALLFLPFSRSSGSPGPVVVRFWCRFWSTIFDVALSFARVPVRALDKMHDEWPTEWRRDRAKEGTLGVTGRHESSCWYVRAITGPPSLDKLLIPESWPLSPLNPDKERYLAPSRGQKERSKWSRPSPFGLLPFSLYRFLLSFFSFWPSLSRDWGALWSTRLDFLSVVRCVLLDVKKKIPFKTLFLSFVLFSAPLSLSFLWIVHRRRRDSASRLSVATFINFLGIAEIRNTGEFLFRRLLVFLFFLFFVLSFVSSFSFFFEAVWLVSLLLWILSEVAMVRRKSGKTLFRHRSVIVQGLDELFGSLNRNICNLREFLPWLNSCIR